MSTLSKINTALSMTSGVIQLGVSGYTFYRFYEDWTRLQQIPHLGWRQKLQTLLRGALNGADLSIGALTVIGLDFEKNFAITLAASRDLPTVLREAGSFIPHTPGGLENADRILQHILQRGLLEYRMIQFALEKLQGLGLSINIAEHTTSQGITFSSFSCIAERLCSLLITRSKIQCQKDLSPAGVPILFANALSLGLRCLPFVVSFANRIALARKKNSMLSNEPLRISGYLLVRYILPSRVDDPSLKYRKIPEQYYAQEPFCQEKCGLTTLPVTEALFIVTKGKVYIFEKEALVKYIFSAREQEKSLMNPSTECSFTEEDIYRDWDRDNRVSHALMMIQAQTIDQISGQKET